MEAVLWRDFLCPWCYLGRDRTALIESLGVRVTARSYELHPELAPEGRAVRPGGRFAAVLARIADECAAVDLPFRVPTRVANTRRALEVAELVRALDPAAARGVDDDLSDAQWVHDLDLGDPAVVDGIVAGREVDLDAVHAALDAGEGARLVDRARAEALDHGVTGAPSWWVDGRLLIPGVQERDTVRRWVERLAASREERPTRR